jgi:hypothetical protein
LPVKVRAASEQSIPHELVQRIADLTARFAELSEYVQCATSTPDDVCTNDTESLARPIEYLTENGFAIVRSWEINGSPVPTDGSFSFLVRDAEGAECEVVVEIAHELIRETAFSTRGRVQVSSSFWICCAERHLADYVSDHDTFPDGHELLVETLDPEEVILAMRWEKSD